MSIEKQDFESIKESDLKELIEAQVPEGLRLDFKLTTYGKSDKDKRELLKDVSALANSFGGHLVLGVKEKEGVAVKLVGLDLDLDAEILRIEQILRNAIEPTITGVRIRPINLAKGNSILLIRVPRSWNPPHRVSAQGTNKFYMRHSAGVHEPSIEELRILFNQTATGLEQSRNFRNNRIQKVIDGEGNRPLIGSGRLFFHIVPIASFSNLINLDLETVHSLNQSFWPFGASGMTPMFNYLGYVNERGGDINHGYTQVFRNGSIEATKGNIVREHNGNLAIPGAAIEREFFEKFEKYINGLRDLEIPPPLVLMVSFEGVKGARYAVKSDPWGDPQPVLPNNVIYLPECLLEDYGTTLEYHKMIRPAFDALWNATGFSKSQFFNEDGLWVGQT